jgi:hypothetical protein
VAWHGTMQTNKPAGLGVFGVLRGSGSAHHRSGGTPSLQCFVSFPWESPFSPCPPPVVRGTVAGNRKMT